MDRISRTYRFEVLEGGSFFWDNGKGNRLVAEVPTSEEKAFEFALSSELYEEFDGEIDVLVVMKNRTIIMRNFKPSTLHTSWEEFAFRRKGIAITSKYHIRLVETM